MQQLNRKEIGRRIRSQREILGITREAMAEALEVTAKFLADIELGNKGLSTQTLYSVSQYLTMTTDYILTGWEYDPSVDEKIKPLTMMLKACKPEKLKYAEALMRDFIASLD
jgi:transcriptional regulator with XRE-family HTH domain